MKKMNRKLLQSTIKKFPLIITHEQGIHLKLYLVIDKNSLKNQLQPLLFANSRNSVYFSFIKILLIITYLLLSLCYELQSESNKFLWKISSTFVLSQNAQLENEDFEITFSYNHEIKNEE